MRYFTQSTQMQNPLPGHDKHDILEIVMKINFTRHAEEKFAVLKLLGWNISKTKVKRTLATPRWRGASRFGQETAMSLLDKTHILRVIFNRENDKITVITCHPARRGKYESTI